MSESRFEVREYRLGDDVPRSTPAPETYKDQGWAGIGRCENPGCGRSGVRKKIERGGQTKLLCTSCASKAKREASKTADEAADKPQPASGPEPEIRHETETGPETKPITEPKHETSDDAPAPGAAMTPTEMRLACLACGHPPIPVIGKRPAFNSWPNCQPTESIIAAWERNFPEATNTSVLTRLTPFLDLDILIQEAADDAEALVAGRFGDQCILKRFGQPPKRAIPFQTAEPFKKITVTLIPPNAPPNADLDPNYWERVEFLCDGQQCVVYGIHPDTRKPYSWHGGTLVNTRRSNLPGIDAATAQGLVDDIVELLISKHGYRRKDEQKPRGAKTGNGPADWGWFLDHLIDHDDDAAFAMSLLRSGMRDGAAVNFLRAWVNRVQDVDPDRKQRRLDEIPGMVSSARAKLGEEKNEQPQSGRSLDEWSAGANPGPIKPRSWLLGNQFCCGFISSLFAAGGVGKSALRLLQFISMALGQPLCGQHVFRRCRVLLISLEDDMDELQRRIQAVLMHHGIERSELEGWMWCATPIGRKIALQDHNKRIVGDLEKSIREAIERRKPDVVGIDPFIKLHSLEENDSGDMSFVCDLLMKIATETNIAVDIPHHVHKGQIAPGDADAGRGSSGIRDAGRLIYTLTVMSETEAGGFNISPDERFGYVRLDSAKVNIASRATAATWFRITGVNIENGTDEYPAGDNVQVAEPWKPPDAWTGLSNHTLNAILNAIDAGCVDEDDRPTGERFSNAASAKDRAAWPVVQKLASDKSEAQCRTIIQAWVKSGLLLVKPYNSPSQRRERKGLYVDNAKRPGTYTKETASSNDFQ